MKFTAKELVFFAQYLFDEEGVKAKEVDVRDVDNWISFRQIKKRYDVPSMPSRIE